MSRSCCGFGGDQVGTGILFIVALFFLACAGCGTGGFLGGGCGYGGCYGAGLGYPGYYY